MENYEEIIDYATVIEYAFKKYPLKRMLKELGKKEETPVTEAIV